MRNAPLSAMEAAVGVVGADGVALIGGMALGAWGVGRSTADADLLLWDRDVFNEDRWRVAREAGVTVDVRRGDPFDPLVGVVRLRRGRGAPVDLVLLGAWTAPMQQRAVRRVRIRGVLVPLVDAADLVLLKLYAGGPLDLRDVELLLLRQPDLDVAVLRRLAETPDACAEGWVRLRSGQRPRPIA